MTSPSPRSRRTTPGDLNPAPLVAQTRASSDTEFMQELLSRAEALKARISDILVRL